MQHDEFEREMAIRDHEASIAAERQHGYSEGFEDGREEEKRKTVLNMLADNLSDETVIRYTGITSEELAEIKAGIKA